MYNTKMRTFPREAGLYLLAFFIGIAVRLVGLGTLPLTDTEASWALKALNIANGMGGAPGSAPAYVGLTAASFFVVGGASNALARLIPALTGSALILVPALFRERIKPRPAVILAFTIALDPGLAAISRQAGSSIMAITFTFAALGFWDGRQFAWAGVCAGMALLAGPGLWPGLLGLGIAWALWLPFDRGRRSASKRRAGSSGPDTTEGWRRAGTYAAGAIILVGTLFMTVPTGVSGWLGGLPDYISGWTRGSDISIGVMLGSLVGYQPVALVLAAMAVARGWRYGSVRVRLLSLWMLVSLLLALFKPSREVPDLAWMLIPLWALAALEIARTLNVPRAQRGEILGATALTALILVFIWLNFLALRRPGVPPDQAGLRTWLLVGSFFLLVVSLLLVGVGWSARAARYGALWGIVLTLGVYSVASLMAAAGHRQLPNSAELWRPEPQVPMAGLLLEAVQDYSAWSDLDSNAQPVLIAGIDSPALEWLLRDRSVQVREAASAASATPMAVTPEIQETELAATHRGQALLWRTTPVWRLLDVLQWLPFHEAAHQNETVILWVRSDLFPDANRHDRPR